MGLGETGRPRQQQHAVACMHAASRAGVLEDARGTLEGRPVGRGSILLPVRRFARAGEGAGVMIGGGGEEENSLEVLITKKRLKK